MAQETVLVIGATGNIGSSVIIAAQRTGRKVLAIVRNKESEEKMFKYLQSKEGITTVEADVTTEEGVQTVVDQVIAGKLPAFQHVYATVGMLNWTSPVHTIPTDEFRKCCQVNTETNFFAYRATIPYLIAHGGPKATYTLITGGAGEIGFAGVTAISQGSLFALSACACRELAETNVRFNEVMLSFRVDFDAVAEEKHKQGNTMCMTASDFAKTYEEILTNEEFSGCRLRVETPDDLVDMKPVKKLPKYSAWERFTKKKTTEGEQS